eukprot:4267182-Prymnesium_polylepis.1
MAAGMSLLSALLCRATHPARIVKCRFSTGFSHARIWALRVEPFSVIAKNSPRLALLAPPFVTDAARGVLRVAPSA